MKKFGIIFGAIAIVVLLFVGINYWPASSSSSKHEDEAGDFKKAGKYVADQKYREAVFVMVNYKEDMENNKPEGKKWQNLLFQLSEKSPEMGAPLLVSLYEVHPELFDDKEKASIGVANAYIINGRVKDYKKLRDKWKGKEKEEDTWFVLDADTIVLSGNRPEAEKFLKSRTFEGKADTGRLVRLALLYVFENAQTAWEFLSEAVKKDPTNADLRINRARLLEAAGKPALALSEYAEALRLNPKNPGLKDQLAEFYMRNKQYELALQVWSESLAPPSTEPIWLKALFWSHVITPLKVDVKKITPPETPLDPLLVYLEGIPYGEFWNEKEFDKIPNMQKYLNSQQSTFWLRVVDALKKGDEKMAWNLLHFNPFHNVSWNPELEIALKRILEYRKSGTLNFNAGNMTPDITPLNAKSKKESSPFFGELERLATVNEKEPKKTLPPEMHALLTSKAAFSAAFLEAGWLEAALALQPYQVLPDNFPTWVSAAVTQALQVNRGNTAALEFATKQKPSSLLSLVVSEILISDKSPDAALEILLQISKEDSIYGYRAAWLASLIYIDKGQYKEATSVIQDQPRLSKDVLGQETLARIAMLQGNTDEAERIYTALETKSDEARSYLARKAYLDKNWKRAKELTQQLIIKYPNNPTIRQNLKDILEEEKKSK